MAISTYDELKSAIAKWRGRSGDSRVEEVSGDLIALAESRIATDLPLRIAHVDTNLTATLDSRELALPADFLAPIALFLTTFGGEEWRLTHLPPGTFEYCTIPATPKFWSVNGDHIDLDAPADMAHTFRFRYRQRIALSDSQPTNWLLTNHPNVYLFACLVELGAFLRDGEFAATYEQRYQQAVADVRRLNARSVSVSSLVVDPAIQAPAGFDINVG